MLSMSIGGEWRRKAVTVEGEAGEKGEEGEALSLAWPGWRHLILSPLSSHHQ